ncbi:hypothetical protein [Alicyclobacillus sp. SO9]|uniref:hypothetical protein n=1 Tax=Alicyclobacillus sp. SO9 TaxID=2665646 RepID=UPI0018E6E945|nr:hypothetical protein [Alicyclobacillus sp. SO9]QQE79286.1 hypothetical protein GI364_01890 [Alicyclobacillus sp. SO9]
MNELEQVRRLREQYDKIKRDANRLYEQSNGDRNSSDYKEAVTNWIELTSIADQLKALGVRFADVKTVRTIGLLEGTDEKKVDEHSNEPKGE